MQPDFVPVMQEHLCQPRALRLKRYLRYSGHDFNNPNKLAITLGPEAKYEFRAEIRLE